MPTKEREGRLGRVRFLQWNVWYRERVGNILRTLRERQPDIACLQELTVGTSWNRRKNVARYLAHALGMHYFFVPAKAYGTPSGTYYGGNGILSRYPLRARRFVPTNRGTAAGDEYHQERRIYVEASVTIERQTLTVGTTHSSYSHRFLFTSGKKNEFLRLFSELRKHRRAYIFSGDLNSRPHSWPVQQLGHILKHSGPPLSAPTWTTKPFSYAGFHEHSLRWRLDYVFATPDLSVRRVSVVRTPASDHLPIEVEYRI